MFHYVGKYLGLPEESWFEAILLNGNSVRIYASLIQSVFIEYVSGATQFVELQGKQGEIWVLSFLDETDLKALRTERKYLPVPAESIFMASEIRICMRNPGAG